MRLDWGRDTASRWPAHNSTRPPGAGGEKADIVKHLVNQREKGPAGGVALRRAW